MDSITHVAFGALVGGAVLGRAAGRKALGWGAAAATLPDLDVVARLVAGEETYLLLHRGPTHAVAFAVVAAPLLGWLVWRLYRQRGSPAAEAGWRGWTALFVGALLTHALLDALTIYGTQLFWPLSRHPAAYPLLFIIDPLFTLPLVAAVIACWRRAHAMPRWAWAGLGWSGLYLLAALGAKLHAERVFREALTAQGIEAELIYTNPMPFQTLLWTGAAHGGDTLYVGLYGLLDPDREVAFHRLSREIWRFEPYAETHAGRVLTWFTRGWALARPDTLAPQTSLDPTAALTDHGEPLGLVLHDARFGRTDGWLDADGGYLFSFHLYRRADGSITFRQSYPPLRPHALGPLARRVLGHRTITQPDDR